MLLDTFFILLNLIYHGIVIESYAVNDSTLSTIRQQLLLSNWTKYHSVEYQQFNTKRVYDYDWNHIINDLPIYVVFTGLYFTSIACAHRSGAHIITINTGDNEIPLFSNLPKVLVNPHPAGNYNDMIMTYHNICNTKSQFPWDDDGPWVNITQSLSLWRSLFRPAMDIQMNDHFLRSNSHSIVILPLITKDSNFENPNLKDILTDEEIAMLPKYPDVTIHYRCSDNVCVFKMGLLPFHAVLDHIPMDSKYIFIITEGAGHRNYENPLCRPIVEALASDIRNRYPTAHVVVRYGGNVLLAMASLIYSRVSICSSSTFCLFTAIMNTNGKVYLPARYYYNTYFDLENIQTMNNSQGIYIWWIRGEGITRDCHLKNYHLQYVLDILRNRNYSIIHPEHPLPTKQNH